MTGHLKLALLINGEYVPGAHSSIEVGNMGAVTVETPRPPTSIHCETSWGRFEIDLTIDHPHTNQIRDWVEAYGCPGMRLDPVWGPGIADGADARQRRRIMRRYGRLRREIRAAKWTVVR